MIRCGNKTTHGGRIYHANVEAVRRCYRERYSIPYGRQGIATGEVNEVNEELKVTNVIHMVLPYDLTAATLVPESGPHRTASESFEWLAYSGGHSYGREMVGERERVIVSAAILISRGVPIDAALDTAIVWERG